MRCERCDNRDRDCQRCLGVPPDCSEGTPRRFDEQRWGVAAPRAVMEIVGDLRHLSDHLMGMPIEVVHGFWDLTDPFKT